MATDTLVLHNVSSFVVPGGRQISLYRESNDVPSNIEKTRLVVNLHGV